MRKKKIIETKEIIEKSIFDWYFEQGKPMPNWKIQRDPQWWIDYLEELEIDQNNS